MWNLKMSATTLAGLTLLLSLASFAAEEKCGRMHIMTLTQLNSKYDNLANSIAEKKEAKLKRIFLERFLHQVNCELDRTADAGVADKYRIRLSATHTLLTDLLTEECKDMEKSLIFSQTSAGAKATEPPDEKQVTFLKKIAKALCPGN